MRFNRWPGSRVSEPAARLVRTCPHGRSHDPCHLLTIEWLRKNIVTAQIQHFGPQGLIGDVGCHDESRGSA